MSTLLESRNYQLVKIIFENKFRFTKEEIIHQMKKEGFDVDIDEIDFILRSFCEKGLITDYGSYYSVSV